MLKKRALSGFLAAGMGLSILAGALATPATAAIPGAGQEGYASLHQYVSKTDIPGVYKVVMSLSGFAGEIPATEVAVAIDASSSMNLNPADNLYYDSVSGGGGTGRNPAELAYPSQNDYDEVVIDDFRTNWLFPLTGRVYDFTQMSASPGVAQPSAGAQGTRFHAALTGAEMAVETFLTAETNPGADVTAVGVSTFSSQDDMTFAYPYDDDVPYGGPTFAAFAGTYTWGYGQAYQFSDGAAITYSSRIGDATPAASPVDKGNAYFVYEPIWGTLEGLPPTVPGMQGVEAGLTAKWLVDRPYFKHMWGLQTGAETANGTKLPAPVVPDLALRGMTIYDSTGKGKNLLKKDLENVFASTGGAGTFIRAGLEEAHMMFGGDVFDIAGGNFGMPADYMPTPASVASLPAYPNTTTEESRRFVIFLSDLGDAETSYETFSVIDAMKRNGVEFMVIGIDTEGANDTVTYPGVPNALNDLGAVNATTEPYPGRKLYDYHFANSGDSDPSLTGDYSLYGVWMGTKLIDSAYLPSGVYTSWTDVEGVYGSTAGYGNWTGETANYKYARSADEIKLAFQQYVNDIIFFGSDAKGALKLNTNAYELYSYPGKPMYETTGTAGQKVSISGGSISWDMNGGIPLTKENTLTFYVKMRDGLDQSLSYPVLSNAGFSCYGPFPDADNPGAQHPNGGWPDRLINTTWPTAYVKPSGEITEDSPGSIEGGLGSNMGSDKGQSGAEAHQENRESASLTSNYMSTVTDVKPIIRSISTVAGLNGRAKAIVTVENGANMRYQWQYKNDAGEWVNIFGATASQYTLSNMFKVGKEYELRCKITNAAGSISFSEVIKVTQSNSSKSGGLQSK